MQAGSLSATSFTSYISCVQSIRINICLEVYKYILMVQVPSTAVKDIK